MLFEASEMVLVARARIYSGLGYSTVDSRACAKVPSSVICIRACAKDTGSVI